MASCSIQSPPTSAPRAAVSIAIVARFACRRSRQRSLQREAEPAAQALRGIELLAMPGGRATMRCSTLQLLKAQYPWESN